MKIGLNLGSHNKEIFKDGINYINLDILDLPNVDGVGDLSVIPYKIKIKEGKEDKFKNLGEVKEGYIIFYNNTVDEIIAIEFLEHISFHQTDNILAEWFRILKPNGIVTIQVPDIDKMIRYYISNEICECVPHKVEETNQYIPDTKCFVCGGKGKINPNRWLYAFLGAQKFEYDLHRNIFTPEKMKECLRKARFGSITFQEDIYKIKVSCQK